MQFRKLLPLSLAVVLGGCSGTAGSTDSESTAELKKVPAGGNFTTFETLQVRPLALSPSGKLLFACNTPDNRLEIFSVNGKSLTSIGSVVVGLEPLAVAARNENEVWVVNHLSDSVSIVSVNSLGIAGVTRTLLVGDEPRDIVFGGPNHDKAFITTAHRGQNAGDAYDLQTQGVGRADVWVFDANNLGSAAGGTRLTKLSFFADTPRALAASADGKTVYAAAFNSGNQTTSVSAYAVATMYGGHMPGPAAITLGPYTFPQPPTGLVVKLKVLADGKPHWVDAYGTVFDPFVKVKLPDLDVFAIDASGSVPAAKTNGAYAHVGTTLFNMAVNPKSGKVYVTNTDAINDVRFEGIHSPTSGFTSVRGHITDSRITVIDPATGSVTPHDLNPHVDFTHDGNPAEKALSLAFPEGVQVSSDGSKLYTIAQGSQKLAIYNTADVEAGNTAPTFSSQVVLSGGGPTGLAVSDATKLAYVLTRFDNSISVVDLGAKSEVGKAKMFNPEPAAVTTGRKYLYDANLTSQHGTTACASCHIGGDKDELAWDLGNPDGGPLPITHASSTMDTVNANIFTIPPALISQLLPPFAGTFLYNMPVKGPMTTQSLRGMDNHGPMHWRGDRNGAVAQTGAPVIDPGTGAAIISAQPDAGIFNEFLAFTSFNVAFPGLVGDVSMLSDADMAEFANFILAVSYPPNPVRNLDNTLTAQQQIGQTFFFNQVGGQPLPSDRFHNCNGCHTLDPNGNKATSAHPGFFGTDGRLSFEFETQIFKVPHLRNMYTKIGMFLSSPDTLQPGTLFLQEQQAPPTDQIRGFGFQHDGSLGQLEHFFTGQVFLQTANDVVVGGQYHVGPNPYGIPYIDPNAYGQGQAVFTGPAGDPQGLGLRAAIVAYLMAFDSNMMPIVGQQITLTALNGATAGPRINLLEAQAAAGACDLVAKTGSVRTVDAGFLYGSGSWQPSSMILPPVSDANLRSLVQRGALPSLTFTCVPPGSGVRVALDRDGDGYADDDEILAGKNPADPNSHP